MTKLGYRPALDGVRALAIAPVVTLHAFGWPRNESLGVEIFFVLSGFLITILLLEERVATGTISLLSFYRRRAVRLVPALVLMLAVYAIVAHGAHAWALSSGSHTRRTSPHWSMRTQCPGHWAISGRSPRRSSFTFSGRRSCCCYWRERGLRSYPKPSAFWFLP